MLVLYFVAVAVDGNIEIEIGPQGEARRGEAEEKRRGG